LFFFFVFWGFEFSLTAFAMPKKKKKKKKKKNSEGACTDTPSNEHSSSSSGSKYTGESLDADGIARIMAGGLGIGQDSGQNSGQRTGQRSGQGSGQGSGHYGLRDAAATAAANSATAARQSGGLPGDTTSDSLSEGGRKRRRDAAGIPMNSNSLGAAKAGAEAPRASGLPALALVAASAAGGAVNVDNLAAELEDLEVMEAAQRETLRKIEEAKQRAIEARRAAAGPEACVRCLKSRKVVVVLPCAHLCICLACKDNVQVSGACPVCGGAIAALIETK
jgi:hypothetical protein